jgi:hypothetical protein
METQIIWALLTLTVVLVLGLFSGMAGLLIMLDRISKNPAILEAAREGYLRTGEQTRMLIDTLNNVTNLAERLAYNVAPTSNVTRAIDLVEDTLDTITGEVDAEPDGDRELTAQELAPGVVPLGDAPPSGG